MRENLKTLPGVLGGVLLVLLLFSALAGGMSQMASGGMMGGGMFGAISMLVFWGIIVALAVGLVALVLRGLR